ncbi:MAG TPA: hypothetical protein VED40_03650 [Azospirillaceae bacterium]|nr:hypothetical protein [Azospirillaceae bacterium]
MPSDGVLDMRRERVLPLAIAAALVLLALQPYLAVSVSTLPAFDGALNLNVARELVATGRYGSFYDSFALFPVETQTNAPYVLPAALVYAVAGIGVFTSQLVNLLYIAALAAITFRLVARVAGPVAGLAGVMLVLQVPGALEYGMNGYGEYIALFWFLLAVWFLARAVDGPAGADPLDCALGGAALSLSFLTKTVAMIWVAPVSALFALALLWRRAPPAAWVAFAAGLAGPVLAWEVFRLAQLGGPGAFRLWWAQQLSEILSQSGVQSQLQDTPGLTAKLATHFGLLSQQTGLPPVALALFLLVPPLLLLGPLWEAWRRRDAGTLMVLLSVGGVAAGYFLWWLAVTPTEQAWLRRILNGLALQQLTALLGVAWLLRVGAAPVARGPNSRRHTPAMAAAALGALMIWLAAAGSGIGRGTAMAPHDEATLEAARVMAAQPADTMFFGAGWWQAPVLALLSDRVVHDAERWDEDRLAEFPRKIMVFDHYAVGLAPATIAAQLARFESRPLLGGPYVSVHEIKDKPQAETVWPADRLAASVDFSQGDYEALKGFHQLEPGYRWSPGRATVALLRSGQARLSLTVTVPRVARFAEAAPGSDAGVALTLKLDGCPVAILPIPHPGTHSFTVDVPCPPAGRSPEQASLSLSLNSAMRLQDTIPDRRALAFALHRVAFAD